MTPQHTPGRPTRPHPLQLAQTFGPWGFAVLAFLGGRVTSPGARLDELERAERVGIVRDSVSILDRVALAGIVSLVGRDRCLENAGRATELGYPCAALVAGGGWPGVLHAARATVASRDTFSRDGTRTARPPAFVAVALLAPLGISPARRGVE